jgi:diguanylate cyclase (GGDEF)-like protein/PAS domain S-box-containing protein
MFKKLRISQKLLLINLLLGIVVLVVAGGLLLWQSYRQHEQFVQLRVKQQGSIVASNLSAPVLFRDWLTAQQILNSLTEDPAIRSALLLDLEGEVRAEVRRDGVGSGGDLFATRIELLDAQRSPMGALEITASREEIGLTLREALGTIAVITLLSMLLGLAVILRSQRYVTEPLRALSELVRTVRRTKNYTLRAPVSYPDDVGALTDDVNAMLEIIQQRDLDLAHKVEVRTRELASQNTRLQAEILERERTERAARANQAKFENAFLNAPIGMALVVANGTAIQRNSVFDDMMGTAGESSVSLKTLIVADEWPDLLNGLERLARGEESSLRQDVECHNLAGETLTCVMHLSAVRDGDDEFLYGVLQLQDITESKRLASELAHQASHDALTGLANRRVFEQSLESLADGGHASDLPITLGLIDLDQFKVVNDTSGHAAGDALLQQVAETIQSCVRESDLVVRLGGDEFAVMLRRCDARQGARIAELIRAEIERITFTWGDSSFRIGASIGVVPVDEVPGDLDEVLRQADAACFAAKDSGRNRICIVRQDDSQIAEKQGEMHWAHRLRNAIEQDRFVLFGQPVIPLKGDDADQPERLELLLRMRGADGKPDILPGAFLPVAERYGIATQLDQWVITHLLEQLRDTDDAEERQRSYWVNLSGASIGDNKFIEFLERCVSTADLPVGTINFEVTETAVVRNIKTAREAMERLKQQGCRFALDDFGSGLSSFGYLKSLPVDFVKIDGMFVRDIVDDPVDRIFVKSIIDMAGAMDKSTVAEFVESQQILDVVRELGADHAQGYALGRPRPLFDDRPSASRPPLRAMQGGG